MRSVRAGFPVRRCAGALCGVELSPLTVQLHATPQVNFPMKTPVKESACLYGVLLLWYDCVK
jgi:hypothetical protein